MSNARRDPKIIALKMSHGREGVYRFWEIVEMIAEEMNDSDRCEITVNGGFLSRELGFRSLIDGRSFVDRLVIGGLLIADLTSTDWHIKCPKLLELRDHRIKNRVHKNAPEQNRTEVEVKNTIQEKLFTPVDNPVKFPFDDFWPKYPKRNGIKVGKAAAEVQWKKLTPDEQQKAHDTIGPQVKHYDSCKKANVFVAEFPDCERWLRNKRFNDEVSKSVLNAPQPTIDPTNADWVKIIWQLRKNPDSASLDGISDRGVKALSAIGGMLKLKTIHEDHLHFVKEDYKNAWLKS